MEIELAVEILDKLGVFWEDLIYNKTTKITYGDLILAILINRNLKDSANALNSSERTLRRVVSSGLFNKLGIIENKGIPWKIVLLNFINKKQCNSCNVYKSLADFYKDGKYLDHECRTCALPRIRIKSSKYRADKLNRTPEWSNIDEISNIYRNCPVGMQVDHIIPLKGTLVSGLHVPSNLQYLSIKENLLKSNKYSD